MIKPAFISTASLSLSTRTSLARLQKQLLDANTELSTGRHADLGVTLGAKAGSVVSLRQDFSRLKSIVDANSLVKTRLDTSQAAVKSVSDNAQAFLSTLLGAQQGSVDSTALVQAGKAGLGALISSLNQTVDGQHIFAGINTDAQPIADYSSTPTSTSKAAIDAAFTAKFGFPPSDPAVSTITATDITDFLNNELAQEFADPNWQANWSDAADQNIKSRISGSELIETSVSANNKVFRDLASVYTIIGQIGLENLNPGAKQAVVNAAVTKLGGAIGDIAGVQATLGVAQERVTKSNEQLEIQAGVIDNFVVTLEQVDPTEVSARVSTLTTQIETSYTLTKRIFDLSLLNYL